MLKKVLLFLLAACLVAQANAFAEDAQAPRKKLIELGWDIPTTSYIKDHWREMEKSAPFDGIVYDLVARNADGKTCASQSLFTPERWNRDDFKTCVDDLNSCEFTRYKHNFIRINFYPAQFAWSDDEAWRAVCEKAAICAWVAQQTRGDICLDFESYGAHIFKYDPKSSATFEDAKALARRRGAEFTRAILEEKSDVTLLCLWMNSINFAAGRAERPDSVLRAGAYGLLPSFIDGMLDAARPETRFVEGCENGYYMNGREEYQRASLDALLLTGPGAALVSPENRGKYRAQVSSGFGFYLDMYSNPEGSRYYRGAEPGETRFDRLCVNLTAAWDAADEYVWVYGEQKRWWAPTSDAEWTSWEEALPGITEFIAQLSDPERYAAEIKDALLSSTTATNLVKNGNFASRTQSGDGATTFENWGTWRHEDSRGVFAEVDGKPAIKGDVSACYLQALEVEPGRKYLVYGKIGADASTDANLTVRWHDGGGRWVSEWLDVRVVVRRDAPLDANGRGEAYALVKVPEAARRLVLLLSASATDGAGTASFDDVRVYLLP